MSASTGKSGQKLPQGVHGANGNTGSESVATEETLLPAANDKTPHLTLNLMESICNHENLNQALKRVKANKGAAGVDTMSVETLLH